MSFSLFYLVSRFFWRIADFFHHWYFHGSKNIAYYFVGILEKADRTLALKITLRHFFEPLYQDYSVIGRILGVIFRSSRILIGLVAYIVLGFLGLVLYLAWLALPVFLIFGIVKNINL